MSADRFRAHILVLPEDDANRQLARGLLLEIDTSVSRSILVLPVSGGWLNVLNDFESNHIADMDRRPNRYMVLLIDFDDRPERLNYAMDRVPERLRDRVFIIGALSEPENLKPTLGSPGGRAAARVAAFGGRPPTTSPPTLFCVRLEDHRLSMHTLELSASAAFT